MAITYIRQASSNTYSNNLNQTIPASTAGNTLVATVLHQSAIPVTVSSNAGGTWIKAVTSETAGADGQYKVDIWYLLNAASTTTVTATTGASSSALAINVSEYSGITGLRAVDTKYWVAADNPGATVTANAGDLIVAGLAYYNSGNTATPSAPFTLLGATGISTTRLAAARALTMSSGPITPTWSYTPTNAISNRATVLAAFIGAPEPQPTGYRLTATGWVPFRHRIIT